MSNPFLEVVSQFTPLSAGSQSALAAVLKRLELEKGHVLVRQNTVCQWVYFIEKGLTRTYYYKDGKDVTDWLSAEGQFAVSISSFMTQQPDRRIVELLEPSVLWAISHTDLENLYQQHHDIERLGRLLASHGLLLVQQRFDELHFATALERYRNLMALNPTLIQRVPLGMIASYLGMTAETLSRMRAQI
ncbi:Crp/Fnr family transcriptional regulator [Spirosoma validum]|uniref:Crp/Fnr family transcriptional regulator n=1 Tax=Spirosoma validum TaxID=2771355 RepID=A0A927B3Z6_9BACT|nr:Crp/Fnr family transcriptional regulator [Spirosoma validum]MBD2754963.1 Crp/Fnr family transcriptional regulator [Spirosoma validum]